MAVGLDQREVPAATVVNRQRIKKPGNSESQGGRGLQLLPGAIRGAIQGSRTGRIPASGAVPGGSANRADRHVSLRCRERRTVSRPTRRKGMNFRRSGQGFFQRSPRPTKESRAHTARPVAEPTYVTAHQRVEPSQRRQIATASNRRILPESETNTKHALITLGRMCPGKRNHSMQVAPFDPV